MPANLQSIDPNWAWSVYTPDAQQPFNRLLAAHLFRRAGFGVTSHALDKAITQQPAELVKGMISSQQEHADFRAEIDALARTILATNNPENLAAWLLYRLLGTPNQLLEKTTLFWHGHFATGAEKVKDGELMYQQNKLFRKHALGDFRQLVQGISKDPAMLIYLDSITNRKAQPNENYAREVMELFCLGEGNYSEKDVQQVARCFTGWEIRRKKFHFNRYQHDKGEKTIFKHTGPFGGEEAVDIILQQPAAANFIVRKMIHFFLFDEPAVPDTLVKPLADFFRDNAYHVGRLMERMLSSNLFFSKFSVGRKVRSPVELTIGLLIGLESKADVFALHKDLKQLGQALFYPPNVKGWEGGRNWINTSTLLSRSNVINKLINTKKSRFSAGKLEELTTGYGLQKPDEIIDWLVALTFAVPIPSEIRQQFIDLLDQPGDRSRQIAKVIQVMCSLPEFHLG